MINRPVPMRLGQLTETEWGRKMLASREMQRGDAKERLSPGALKSGRPDSNRRPPPGKDVSCDLATCLDA
jgi:hypothetical protein